MNERLRKGATQMIRDRQTINLRADQDDSNRHGKARQQPGCCSSIDQQTETTRDKQSRWFPMSLVALVVFCLMMAAWVWFEILWMSP